MGESKERLLKAIKHYQDSLVKHTKTGNSQKLVHAIEKLGLLPIRVCHLQETGVGRTVNSLKKFDGSVGENARILVDKWKYMVQEEEEKEKLEKLDTELQKNSEVEESDDDALQIVDEEQNRDKKVTAESKQDNSSSQHKPSNSERMREKDSHANKHKSHKYHTSSRHHDDSDSSNSSIKKSSESDSSNSKSSSSSSESSDNEQTSGSDSDEGAKHKSKDKSSSKSHSSAGTETKQQVSNDNSKYHDAKEAFSRNKESEKRDKKDDVSNRKRHRSKSPKIDTKRRKTESKSKHHEEHNHSKHGQDKKKDYHNKSVSHKSSLKETSNHSNNSKRDREQESKRDKTEQSASSSSKDTKRDKHRSHTEKEGIKKSESKRSSDTKSKLSSSSSKPLNSVNKLSEGIDSGSGTSFADVLGMLQVPSYSKSKKKSVGTEEKSAAPKEDVKQHKARSNIELSSQSPNGAIPNLLKDPVGLQPLDINVSNLLPSITPNYKPLGLPLDNQNRKVWTDDEALTRVITAKHQRTKVYSGNKSSYTKVPTLFEICTRILQENLDALEYTGGVPYSVLKPVLERASPDQLYQLEFHNPYLIEDTDELWQLHCQKEFRNKNREELETWREMYLRCLDEREAKLKALTANIKQSQDKSLPVRQTKLAYVDSVVKPPRNIARKQAKNGVAVNIKRPLVTPSERLIQISKAGEDEKVAVPNPRRAAVERGSSSSHSAQVKPKKAPLMAKTLSLLKNRFGRR